MRLGIDPGIKGAIALINGAIVVDCWDMPTYSYDVMAKDRTTGKQVPRKRNRVDGAALYLLLKDAGQLAGTYRTPLEIVVERQQHNMGKSAVDSPMVAFNVGLGYGSVLTAVEIVFGRNYTVVHPNSWKTKAGLKKASKGDSIELCVEQFDTKNFITLKKHEGRAEAILIAYYGL